jgi:hypothetical protein
VPHAVENDLSNSTPAVYALASRFIIDGLRQAIERTVTVGRITAKHKLACGRVGPFHERALGILLFGFFCRKWL